MRKGFTLIELMIVIAIIAVIVAIAIPNLIASKTSANESTAVANLKAYGNSQFQYREKTDYFACSGVVLFQRGLITKDFRDSFRSHHSNGEIEGSPKAGYLFRALHGQAGNELSWVSSGTGSSMQLATWGATCRANEPTLSGDFQFYITEVGSVFKKREPVSTDANFKMFLLNAAPAAGATSWTIAK